MKAAWYTENGGPEVMQYGDLPDPEVHADTVVIAVEWISIEGGDLLNRLVSPPRVKPFVPGYQLHRITYAPENEVGWWRWVRGAKKLRGDVLLFQNRLESGYDL